MIKKYFYFLLFLIIGLVIFFWHTAVAGFDLMPGNAGDASLSNYILEHFWLWLNQIPQHQSFWDMPFYYPNKNTLAYSDVMAGGALIYIPVRFFIKDPFTTFQIWLILLCSVNYAALYLFLRKLKYPQLSCAIGAFIFAFGVMRYFKMFHPNYYIQYPMILAMICLFYLKQNKHLAIGGFFAFLSLQFWSVYTYGYMFCFTAFVLGVAMLFYDDTKNLVKNFFKTYYKEICLYGILFIISLIPLAWHYLMLGMTRSWPEVFYHFTGFSIWFRNISILDNVILKYLPPINEHDEVCGGIGLITMAAAFYGLWRLEKYRKQIFITLIFLMLLCVKYGYFSPWFWMYKFIPGANGIRVVSRIYFIFLIFYSIGLAELFKSFDKKLLILLFSVILLIEQLPSSEHTYLWSKKLLRQDIMQISNSISSGCKVLYYENSEQYGLMDVLIMWIASFKGIYSANGSSGVVKEKVWQNNAGYCVIEFNGE